MIDFNRMVDNHIAREHRPKRIGRYYPSEIGSCMRKVWYSYKYPLEVDPELLKVFEVGNIMHGFVVEVLGSERNKDVKLLKSEFPFKIEEDGFIVSGRVDDLLLVRESGKELLVEVKSTKDISFAKSPQPGHVMQLMFYMLATKVHDGVVLYIDKNNLQSKAFDVKFDGKEAEKIRGRFKALHDSLTQDGLPADEAKRTDGMAWMCRYCEYKAKCDRNGK